jgi:hypothetical protein
MFGFPRGHQVLFLFLYIFYSYIFRYHRKVSVLGSLRFSICRRVSFIHISFLVKGGLFLSFVDFRIMFEPVAPLEYKPPLQKRSLPPYTGVSQYLSLFEKEEPSKPKPFETPLERKKALREKMLKLHKEKNEIFMNDWDAHNNSKATESVNFSLSQLFLAIIPTFLFPIFFI